ncbi:MAG: hypothetical protein V2I63_06540 [Pseudomonadales bacterium]|nr:hypothetical protein [Pseudomonadales bacterium]
MAGLERVVAVRFADGARFPLPPGNALRSAGDIAEIRALLEGWPRSVAAALKTRIGHDDPCSAGVAIDAALAALGEPSP